MYPKIITEHFMHPRNVGRIANPTSIGVYQTPSLVKAVFYFLIEQGIVKDIKYQVAGCPYAIAVASIISEYSKGKNVSELSKIGRKFLENYFVIAKEKEDCIDLSLKAFLSGIHEIKK